MHVTLGSVPNQKNREDRKKINVHYILVTRVLHLNSVLHFYVTGCTVGLFITSIILDT